MDEMKRDEEDAVEDAMDEEIVSLTLDPPPATAAAVLQQHHHCRHHGSSTEQHRTNESNTSDQSSSNELETKCEHCQTTKSNGVPANKDQSQLDEGLKTSDTNSPNIPDIESTEAQTQTSSQTVKREVIPKKSSLSCHQRSSIDDLTELPKNKRRVSFPDEDKMVTMAVEPIDPWKNVTVTKSSEVIKEYRKACKQMKTKPIENLTRQLQDLPDLACRIATLSLKGTRLDNKACEALEAIFRRIRFEVIDFENCGLEEEGATALLEMIEFYQSACRLNIALNPKIGMRGWQTLCKMLRKTPCLHSLNARRTMLTDQTMPMFGRCLKADPYLRTLHLEGVYLSGRHLLILTTALKYNTILEELYLGDNDLQPADGVSIGAMLGANSTLQLLDLRNNGFRDGGLVHIANGLTDQANQDSGGLTSIVLWNLGLTHEGMYGFCNALAKSKTLRSLNLGQNRIADIGIQKIKPGLIRNRSLRKLGLMNTKIGNEGAVALAEILADSVSIARIDVRENHIQIAGLMALSLAMKVNHTLTRIDLDKELRKEPGLETVQQSVLADVYNYCHRNKQLTRDSFSRESSTSEDCEAFLTQDFNEKESDEDRSDIAHDSIEEIKNNPKLVSSLHSLAAKDSEADKTDNSTQPVSTVDVKQEDTTESLKNSSSVKPRFTITRIMESIGQASADVANKLAGNVRLDSSANSRRMTTARTSMDSPKSSPEKSKSIDLKTLQRQNKVGSVDLKDGDNSTSPTRSRNKELKEFYRRLKDGEIDSSQTELGLSKEISYEKQTESNQMFNDNHIENLPFPGKAKKLNDSIEADVAVSEILENEEEELFPVQTEVENVDFAHVETHEIVNGPSSD